MPIANYVCWLLRDLGFLKRKKDLLGLQTRICWLGLRCSLCLLWFRWAKTVGFVDAFAYQTMVDTAFAGELDGAGINLSRRLGSVPEECYNRFADTLGLSLLWCTLFWLFRLCAVFGLLDSLCFLRG